MADPSGRLVAGIAGSNLTRGMDVCLLCLYAVLSCDGLITRPQESYRMSNCMCDHRNLERGPMFQLGAYRKMNDSVIRSFREAIHAPVGKVKKN
jgi:hypothetical protein